jgi:hypothetical protein
MRCARPRAYSRGVAAVEIEHLHVVRASGT